MLPDYLQQGLGFSPPAGDVPDFGGLHPSVAQALGLAGPPPAPVQPPPLEPVQPEPQPLQLPSAAGQPQQPEPSKDFTVPVAAIDGPGTPAPRPAVQQPQRPVKPPTSDQLAVQAQQKQDVADEAQLGAIRESETAQRAQAADEQQVLAAHDERVKQLEQEQKAFRDDAAKARAQKEAYAQSTLAAVDSYKIDQNKFMNELGMGQAVGWGIGAALATIGDSLRGQKGPNPVIQMMQDKMQQAVRAQVDERDQLKERAGRAGHALDRYDAFTKDKESTFQMRMAEGERMLGNMLRSSAAKYKDANIQAGADAEAAKLYQSSADRAVKAVDSAATREHQQKQLAISGFQASEAARHNKAMEALTSQQRDIEATKALRAGQLDQAKLIRERALGGEVKQIKDANGNVVGKEYGLLTDKKGDVFVPNGNETTVSKVQEQHRAHLQFLATIDDLLRLGPEWLLDTANTDKKQRIDQLWNDLVTVTVQMKGMGVPQIHDIEIAKKVAGTSDPTRFLDSLAGLKQGRASALRNHNEVLKSVGYDKVWDPEDFSKPPNTPAVTDVDKALKITLGDAANARPGAFTVDGKVRPLAEGPDVIANGPKYPAHVRAVQAGLAHQRQLLDTFASWTRSDDPAIRKRGFDFIEKNANDADEKEIRDYAQRLLLDNVTRGAQPSFTENIR